MTIIALLVALALVGLVTWLLVTFVPMPQALKTVLIVVAVIIAILVAAAAFGVTGNINTNVPHL